MDDSAEMHSQRVAVIGLGRVGLPTAAMMARAGHEVVGVDADDAHLAWIREHGGWADEPGLATLVHTHMHAGALTLTSDLAALPFAPTVYVLALPSAASDEALPTALAAIIEEVSALCTGGELVVVESTLSPAQARRVVARVEQSGWHSGEDLYVAHAPERIAPGRALEEWADFPRLTGGATPRCTARAHAFYSALVTAQVTPCTMEEAACSKLMENATRHVQIALANELADICTGHNLSMDTIAALANTHPRVDVLSPGAGIGGRCLDLAVDLLGRMRGEHVAEQSVLAAARRSVADLPARLATDIASALPASAQVALCGLAYKPNVGDTTNTPALALAHRLREAGVTVLTHDPFVSTWQGGEVIPFEEAIASADALVFATAHASFGALTPHSVAASMNALRVFDLCGVLDHDGWRAAGFEVFVRGGRWPSRC